MLNREKLFSLIMLTSHCLVWLAEMYGCVHEWSNVIVVGGGDVCVCVCVCVCVRVCVRAYACVIISR